MNEIIKDLRNICQFAYDQGLHELGYDPVEAIEKELNEWRKALCSLTPGGSEYATDPQACVNYVREVRTSQMDLIRKLKQNDLSKN